MKINKIESLKSLLKNKTLKIKPYLVGGGTTVHILQFAY